MSKNISDSSGYIFTIQEIGINATIIAINNTNVLDKTTLFIPPKIELFNITNVTAQIPQTVKTLKLCSGLLSPGNSTGCAFTNIIIVEGLSKSINDYKSLQIGVGCNLTIEIGITTLNPTAFTNLKNFTGFLSFPSGLIIISGAFTGCLFSKIIITKGTTTTISNYQALPIPIAIGCTLSIDEGITTINADAFKNCKNFSGKLTIPSSVSTIGNAVFYGCSGFTSVLFYDNLTTIGLYAFYGCSGLTGELILPKGPTANSTLSIPEYTFYGCSGLTKVIFGENVTTIGKYAFYGCSGLTGELIFPKGRTPTSTFSIPEYAFYGCSRLTKLTFGENITSIAPYAFYGCSGLTGELIFPKGRTPTSNFSIPEYGFYGCSRLTKLTFGENITSIGKYAFYGCSGLTDELKFPKTSSFWNIPDYAFYGCSSLTKVTFGENITNIGSYAFSECASLAGDFVLPTKLSIINDGTFSGCSSLSGDLRIHSNIETIGKNAFSGCSGFNGKLIFETTRIKTINEYAFLGCYKLIGSISIPASVTYIGDYAFYGCSKMSGNLILPKFVTFIGENAFSSCSELSGQVKIPSLVTSVGYSSFGNGIFTKMLVPDTLSISSLTLPIEYYDTKLIVTDLNANYNNSEKSHLIINTGLSIKRDTFEGCKFNKVTIQKGNTSSIGKQEYQLLSSYLERNCSLTIEPGITFIDVLAFNYCVNFSGVLQINNTETITINASAFSCCDFSKISTTSKMDYILK
jgi:hypothetical protein